MIVRDHFLNTLRKVSVDFNKGVGRLTFGFAEQTHEGNVDSEMAENGSDMRNKT